ncbi:MAG: hypothetical protein ABSH48_27670 [Verrucomicrobiota bacterium]|jgi:hypothetical protein
MKRPLKYSLLLNAVLLGGLIFYWADRQKIDSDSTSPVPSATPPSTGVPAAPVAQIPPRVDSAPFRWGQLYGRDYGVYVANLRAAGCPAATVRAIVTADVHAAYQARVQALERKLAEVHNASWSDQLADVNAEAAFKAQLQDIPDLEMAEINDFLGVKPVPLQVVADAGTPERLIRQNPPSQQEKPVSAPLAFQPVDLAALGLNDLQMQEIANVRQTFLDQIGGTNQDPNDPAYLARWQKFQPAADGSLRGMLGNRLYDRYEMLVNPQASSSP